jgi:hypothetical protein
MSLSDFATLADAQAHFVLGRVNKNDFANHDATYDIEKILDDTLTLNIPAELRKIVRVFRKIINGLLDDPDVGDSITQAALTALVATPDSICAYTQSMRDHLEELSKTYPHANATQLDFDESKDAGETIAIVQNNDQHVITVSIATAPRKPASFNVQHRFGSSAADMTDWHDCGTVQNVEYTQRSYQTVVPASPAAYRELRLISPLSLGVSIV